MEGAARAQGKNLSVWLREAAQEKMDASAPPALVTGEELRGFFSCCDQRETGREPDWEAHRRVIEASKTTGAPDS